MFGNLNGEKVVNAVKLRREKVDVYDAYFPIKTYITNSEEQELGSVPHLHEEIEIIHITAGTMEFQFEGESVRMEPGSILLINGSVPHSSEIVGDGHTEMCLLQFPISMLYDNTFGQLRYFSVFMTNEDFRYLKLCADDNGAGSQIAGVQQRIIREFNEKQTGYELIVKAELYQMIALLFRYHKLETSFKDNDGDAKAIDRISEILHYIEGNYSRTITAEDVSTVLNLNYSYFCRVFKKITGQTFIQYLNYYRVGKAKKMLIETNDTIYGVMSDCGFSSLSNFNRVFKRTSGYAPSEFRIKFSASESHTPETEQETELLE